MKNIPSGLRTHLDSRVTTLTTLWKITRMDGRVFHFTDHDTNLVFEGDTYVASSGYRRTAVVNNVGLSADNMEVLGVFDGGGLTEQDIRLGLFDYATVEIYLVNWANLADGALRIRKGKFGEVVANHQGMYQAELRGLAQLMAQNIMEVYSAECRADLGDHRCKIPIDPPILGREQQVEVGEVYRVPTASATGVVWSNLGVNTGFNQSPVGTNQSLIAGWTVLSGLWSIHASHMGLNPYEGPVFISGGESAVGVLEQIIPLEDIGIDLDEIDAGDVEATFSIQRANQTSTLHTGRVIVQFRGAAGNILGTPLDTGSEAITPEDTWVERGFSDEPVPAGTRSIRIQLSYARVSGSVANTSFDGIQLSVNETARSNTFSSLYQNRIYEVVTAGETAASQPAYDPTVGEDTEDGTAFLRARQSWTRHGHIIDVISPTHFLASFEEGPNWFNQGAVRPESGENTGKAQEIKQWTANQDLELFLPFPFAVIPGQKVTAYPGCNKSVDHCSQRFNNILNYRGEPDVPGTDSATQIADVKR